MSSLGQVMSNSNSIYLKNELAETKLDQKYICSSKILIYPVYYVHKPKPALSRFARCYYVVL